MLDGLEEEDQIIKKEEEKLKDNETRSVYVVFNDEDKFEKIIKTSENKHVKIRKEKMKK